MSVDLSLSADQQAVEDLFGAFFAKESPPSLARAAEPLGFDAGLRSKVTALGAPGMGVPTDAGGGGASCADLVVVAEALGRAIAPVPLVEHIVAARAFGADGPAGVVDGSTIATVGLWPADADGMWRLVPGGAVSEWVIGVAGDDVVAVRSEPPGAAPRNHACAPIADRSARGELLSVASAAGWPTVIDEWKVLTAAALVGIAGAALDIGVDYAQSRHQFGLPIGSFQAVQHGLAELPGMIDGARLLVHKAAWARDRHHSSPAGGGVDDNDVTDPSALASMAFVFAADVAARATDRSLHYHGGYGFAEEYDIQLYYRRARGWALVLDDPARECLRLADQLFGPAQGS